MTEKLDKVDVVIVGSGWAGGIVAAELTKQGHQVVMLERGQGKKPADYATSKDELRYSMRYDLMQDLSQETLTWRSKRGKTAIPVRNNDDARLGTDTGGAGVHWNGWSFRWLPYDFEIYSKTVARYGKDKIPEGTTIQDWGITYDELEPYYDRFEKTAGISGEPSPLGPPRSDKFPNPPMKNTPSIKLFKKATRELGFHPYHMPSANVTRPYINPDDQMINACVYCAFCEEYGCGFNAKASPVLTVLPTAQKTGNLELRNNANVTRVAHDGKQATGLVYIDTRTGKTYEQPAAVVVLAGFVFTNTRLLLLSNIGKPYDPETGEGIIGKNFTGHFSNISTYIGARGFFKHKKFNTYMGTGALGATIDDFSGDNQDHDDLDFLHGFEIHYGQPGNRPIANNSVPKGTPKWGQEFKDKSLYYFNRNLFITPQTGFLPNRNTYMDLDPTYKDVFGDPLLRVTCEYQEQDRQRAKAGVALCEKIMKKMGADIVDVEGVADDAQFNGRFYTDHFFGGAIMGSSPGNSAVNTYSQMWGMDNLFVVGGSSFPHNSNYNPTGTIGAFAYRAAEGINQYFEQGGGLVGQQHRDEQKA